MGLALATAGSLACTRTNPSFGAEAGDSGTGGSGGATTNDPSVASAESATTKSTMSSDTVVDTTVSDEGPTSDFTGETTRGDPDATDTLDPATEGVDATTEGDAVCGNGIIESGEDCESEVALDTCADMGFGPGQVTCTNECKQLVHCCGDGNVDPEEMCELGMFYDCEDYGLSADFGLQCNALCQLPDPGCPACGDGLLQPDVEDCDFEGVRSCADEQLEVIPGDASDMLTCDGCEFVGGCCIPNQLPCSHGSAVECCSGFCEGEVCVAG